MSLKKALLCEFLGTAFLLAAVVGSGILADKLDEGNLAVSVLSIAFATGGVLSALIFAFGEISAHFNPIVSLALAIRREFAWSRLLPYWLAQVLGACVGVILSNLMFELPAVSISETVRSGYGQWIGEFIATFGLLGIIFGCSRSNPKALPLAVPFYVAGAIYFTSSTCFANPAVTISRALTASLCGINPSCVLPFILSQITGCAAALLTFGWLFEKAAPKEEAPVDELVAEAQKRTKLAAGRKN